MVNFGEIRLPRRDFSVYEQLGNEVFHKVLELSKELKGKRIIHINSTENGGGVAEILQAQVALENDLGLRSHWYVIHPPEDFFLVTKKIHNMLQGFDEMLTEDDKQFYLSASKKIGDEMDPFLADKGVDLIVTHDPQPLLIGCCNLSLRVPRILRLHMDMSSPKQEILDFLKPFVEVFEKVIVSRADYRPSFVDSEKTAVIMPSIDPVSAKNITMSKEQAWRILKKLGIDNKKPLITQVSRFDKFKDPIGVINAYKIVKEKIPKLQLLLAGIMEARDDPEAQKELEAVQKAAGDDSDIFIIYDAKQLRDFSNDEFINAAQTASTVIIQKSLQEGFGLTVTEAMWKGTAVVGGNVAGIKLQIENGENGFLVNNPEEAAEKIELLLNDEKFRESVGDKAKQTVRENFLMPKYISDNLEVYKRLFSK